LNVNKFTNNKKDNIKLHKFDKEDRNDLHVYNHFHMDNKYIISKKENNLNHDNIEIGYYS